MAQALLAKTVIPAHTRVDGLVETAGDLAVEGQCSGVLAVEGILTVAAGATCRASVQARGATIHGEVIGNVVCRDTIHVAAGARVVGDLRAPDISVDAAGEVDGKVDLLPPEPARAPIRRVPLATRGPALTRPAAPPRPAGARAIPSPPRPTTRVSVRRRDPHTGN